MSPLLLVAGGLVALAAGSLVLRSYGTRYRVGRLLASTPGVTVAEAIALAEAGSTAYVRVAGRIDSDDEFEDPDHRPLVLRRTRLEVLQGRRWRSVIDDRRSVPFRINEGLDEIGIDRDALDAGLVVIARISEGVAREIPDSLPADLPPETPVRLRIEQLSSVEHATVLGMPGRDGDGRPTMTAGAGRPLVLTPLAVPEAIRILGEGRARPLATLALLGSGLSLVAVGIGWALVDAVVS